jgi:hypothetical protein
VKAAALFAAACAATIVLLGALLGLLYRSPAERRALVASATIAFVVQVATFVAVRAAGARRLITAWGAAGGVRLVTLIVYGLVVVRALGYPPEAALLSLATFLFVTTLVETRLISI